MCKMKLRDVFGYEGQPHKIVFQPDSCWYLLFLGSKKGMVLVRLKRRKLSALQVLLLKYLDTPFRLI